METKNKIFIGDSLKVLRTFKSESIDMCITSPPYWALRDYGVKGQLGVEPNFNAYLKRLCNILDEVKRVLKREGTLWVNLGDTYNSHSAKSKNVGGFEGKQMERNKDFAKSKITMKKIGVPDKSMFLIPQRFVIEMVDNRGWTLRNDIVWRKPNPSPSSAIDRFTNNHEFIFFFSKSNKYQFNTQYEYAVGGGQRLKRSVWTIAVKPSREAHFAMFPSELVEQIIRAGCVEGDTVLDVFLGSGTTALAALKLNRKYAGIEINRRFANIAKRRIQNCEKSV